MNVETKLFSRLPVRPTCDCVARSAYLRLRSLCENQHSAAFAFGLVGQSRSERNTLKIRILPASSFGRTALKVCVCAKKWAYGYVRSKS